MRSPVAASVPTREAPRSPTPLTLPGARVLARLGHALAVVRVQRPEKAAQSFRRADGAPSQLARGLHLLATDGVTLLAPLDASAAGALLDSGRCSRRLARTLRRHLGGAR